MTRSDSDVLSETGWLKFRHDPRLAAWSDAVRPEAIRISTDPAARRRWLRHGGTWFAGVSVLGNRPDGSVGPSGPLSGRAIGFIERNFGSNPWDLGQVSACYRGYPACDPGESVPNHRYRRDRDAAHVDGLHPVGPRRRRHLREHHRFILGIPLTEQPPEAAPFVVWEGSHEIVRTMLKDALEGIGPESWGDTDITEAYQEARREIWSRCERREVPAQPGEAYLVHRMALHGMATWPRTLHGPDEGRIIAYFRPAGSAARAWLDAP